MALSCLFFFLRTLLYSINPYIGFECQTDEGVKRYTDAAIRAMNTGLFKCFAHPDLFMRHRTEDGFNAVCQDASRDLCLAARENDIPIEYNLLGVLCHLEGKDRGYPSPAFWRYVKPYAGDVLLGVDAHDPAHLTNPLPWETATRQLQALGYSPITQLKL